MFRRIACPVVHHGNFQTIPIEKEHFYLKRTHHILLTCFYNLRVVNDMIAEQNVWVKRVLSFSLGTLRSNDADNNENVKKTIGLISTTTTSHVHHAFLYISLPFLQDYDVKMPNFAFYGGCKQAKTKFSFSFWAWIWSLEIQLGGFAYNWQSKWVGIIGIKTEKTQIHFLSDVLVAVASLDLKVPISSEWNTSCIRKARVSLACDSWRMVMRGVCTFLATEIESDDFNKTCLKSSHR